MPVLRLFLLSCRPAGDISTHLDPMWARGKPQDIYIYDQASMLLLKVIAFFLYRKHAGLETQMRTIGGYRQSGTDLVATPN